MDANSEHLPVSPAANGDPEALRAECARLQQALRQLEEERARDRRRIAELEEECADYRRAVLYYVGKEHSEDDWRDFNPADYTLSADDVLADLEREFGL